MCFQIKAALVYIPYLLKLWIVLARTIIVFSGFCIRSTILSLLGHIWQNLESTKVGFFWSCFLLILYERTLDILVLQITLWKELTCLFTNRLLDPLLDKRENLGNVNKFTNFLSVFSAADQTMVDYQFFACYTNLWHDHKKDGAQCGIFDKFVHELSQINRSLLCHQSYGTKVSHSQGCHFV